MTEFARSTPQESSGNGDPVPTLPVETLRDWYVTVCGGWSPELTFDQIGINRRAIERNTSLEPGADWVRVTLLGEVRRPLLFDRAFEVVPLDASYPSALMHSPLGEAVFPEGDEALRGPHAPRPGEQVLLNHVGRRLNRALDPDALARAFQEVLRWSQEFGPGEA